MAIIVRMPEIATGSAEAAIAGWLVSQGDEIEAGQAIVEIETEKATVEYEAEDGGLLAGILLEPGAAAEVGTPIAVLATGGQSAAEALAEAGAAGEQSGGAAQGDSVEPAIATPGETDLGIPSSGAAASQSSASAFGERLFASPLVRKLARERGLQLEGIEGSGPNGRIVRRDIEQIETVPQVDQKILARASESAPVEAAKSERSIASGAPATHYVDVPHNGMRRAIARRLTESKSSVPHFYLVADCRVDELLSLRKRVNEIEGTRVSVNDFVVKAVACALQDVPDANAIWTDDATRKFDGVDISVAVSVPSGLLTPVVRGVERLSLGSLGSTIRELAGRAREGKLKQHELEGGSFSVSNLGMYGTSEFSAILNPPQSGILAVGAAEKRPVVESDGTLGIATMMTVTLSADHRVLDGALAAEWLAAFKKRIEQPMGMLV